LYGLVAAVGDAMPAISAPQLALAGTGVLLQQAQMCTNLPAAAVSHIQLLLLLLLLLTFLTNPLRTATSANCMEVAVSGSTFTCRTKNSRTTKQHTSVRPA
jgi:hypothetical protein